MRSRVLVVYETGWDRRQLEACRSAWSERFEVQFAEPKDSEVRWDHDVLHFIDRAVERSRDPSRALHGVFSSSDYPGAVAAGAIATALGLRGTPPEHLLRAGHKYYSRLAQRACIPEAVPRFALVDPARPETWEPACGFPCFVKPVKGAFGLLARRVGDRDALAEHFGSEAVGEFLASWIAMFETLVARYASFEHGGRFFIAEGELEGELVTVEGCCAGGAFHLLGIVDSTLHPGTRSFARFDYPSALPPSVQERMRELALRIALALGLEDVCFNVEMFWDRARDEVKVLELNPRMAGQFGDLYQKVDGVNSYEVALALACGAELPRRTGGEHAVAASFPLRVFHPARVARAPTSDDVRAAEALFPGTHVWIEVAEGDVLADFTSVEDGESLRYAVVNLGASSRAEAARRLAAVRERLGFVLEPLAAPTRPSGAR